jgi:hypothetical protein
MLSCNAANVTWSWKVGESYSKVVVNVCRRRIRGNCLEFVGGVFSRLTIVDATPESHIPEPNLKVGRLKIVQETE